MSKLGRDAIDRLFAELAARGFRILGPTLRDGAVVFEQIDSHEQLPRGTVDEQGPGRYRLTDGAGSVLFGTTCGPDSAKRHLFPPHEKLATVRRAEGRLSVEEAPVDGAPVAIVGLRSCDLHAVAIQDRVFLGSGPDERYEARRRSAFLVGVDCSRAGATCFCSSMGTGPACTVGFDLALTELRSGEFLARAGTPGGEEVLAALASVPASEADLVESEEARERTAASMGRQVEADGLRDLLYRNLEHPRWQEVAEACLACGNCTSVCPTCFCHDQVDVTSLGAEVAERGRRWASCFSLEFSHLAGLDVRPTRDARYRQWLTHKFAGWFDQFGTSGCVGCGRCITWCPVGIDVTAELAAIRQTDGQVAGAGG
jgi:sulfhydrogenase subunit beta (sulfur reductase)